MAQLSRWMGALLGGDESMPGGADSLDASADSAYDNAPLQADTLGGVVTQIMQLVNTMLNGTDAQVNPPCKSVHSRVSRVDNVFCTGRPTLPFHLLGACEKLVHLCSASPS